MKNVCVEGYSVVLSNDDGDVNENGNSQEPIKFDGLLQ